MSLYWTDEDRENLETVYRWLKANGVKIERNGQPNVSGIINYVLWEKADAIKKAEEEDR